MQRFLKLPSKSYQLLQGLLVLFVGTSNLISTSVKAEALVGELVLVAGACPAGYLPLNGNIVSSETYPELGAVLNRRASQGNVEIRLGSFAPVFEATPVRVDPVGAQNVEEPTDTDVIPQYCIAAGGDTPPLVEVGLKFTQEAGASGRLDFFRVDVSGIELDPQDSRLAGFFQGDIDLQVLQQVAPGITRPNVRFRLINENVCRAYENFRYIGREAEGSPRAIYSPAKAYPGELRLTGVQISTDIENEKSLIKWGNDFDAQRRSLTQGGDASLSPFTYTSQRDEQGRYGFVAADILDERTLVLENRNTASQNFKYRIQAQCGESGNAYNVYYDPEIEHDGRGGSGGFPY